MTVIADKFTQIDNASHCGAFGNNPLPLPSDKQVEAGNYKKGKVSLYGLKIAIEQPQNSCRTGIDKNGKRWSSRLAANYGYILGTTANDGDNVDCFIGSYPQSDRVYIVNQFVNGKFDEHKVMLAYPAESFARSDYQFSYSPDWNGLHSIVKATIKQFKHWLKHGDMSKPITTEQLPITEIEQMNKVFWDSNGNPMGTDLARVMYDLRRVDTEDGLLLDSIAIDDLYHDFGDLMLPQDILDSLNMPYSQIERRMGILRGAFNRAGTDLKVTEPLEGEVSPQIIGPYKKDGVTMITSLFTLVDGQTVSIVFHNPDSTPTKITPTDTIIAWKWLLNKKDITIIVAPEKGEDLKPMDVAKRVMKLAQNNSAAFTRANGKVAEQNQAITDLNTEIAGLEVELAQAKADYEVAKQAADDSEIEQVTNPTPAPSGFVPTHTYQDPDDGTVYLMRNESKEWEDANGITYAGIDGEVEPIKDDPNWPDYGVDYGNGFPEEVVTPEPVDEKVIFAGKEYSAIDLPEDKAKQAWDKALTSSNGNEFNAAKDVYQHTMQGHYVDTSIGKVLIAGLGWQEIKQSLKRDSLRAKTVPYIVSILKDGEAGEFETPYKPRNDDVTGFYPFTKTVQVEDKLVTALVKVAQKQAGDFVYYLRSFDGVVLDSTNGNANLLRGLPDCAGVSESAEPILDSTIEANTGGVNLIILKVTDLDGNEIKELEDDFTSEELTTNSDEQPPTMSDEVAKVKIIQSYHDTDLMLEVADFLGIDSELDESDVYIALTKSPNITPEDLRSAYGIVTILGGSSAIPYEFYSKFEYSESDLADPEENLDIDQVQEKTRTAWVIGKIIKMRDGVVSWGDFNGALSGSIFDSVLNGVVGQFGTNTGGVVGYIEINDDGNAAISINSKGRAVRPPDNRFTKDFAKLKKQIDDAFNVFVETEIVDGDIPDWKTKPEVTVTPVEAPKPLTEIQQYELKLSRLQAMQDRMKAVNKIIKSKTLTDDQKRAKLSDAGFDAEVSMVGKKDFAGRTGYADYELTNNNATIKNTKNRIDELKKRELSASMAASGDRETSYDFDGGTVDLDYDDDRLRVNFNAKPNSDMIAKLKSNGFKWSPTNSAWQRQLTDNAIWSTNYLLGTDIKSSNDLIRDLQNKAVNVPTPQPDTTPQPEPEITPTNSFDADIEVLRGETDYTVFNDKLDELAGKLEVAGLMDQYDAQLNELADLLTELLKKAA